MKSEENQKAHESFRKDGGNWGQVFGLGNNLLFKSVPGHCDVLVLGQDLFYFIQLGPGQTVTFQKRIK